MKTTYLAAVLAALIPLKVKAETRSLAAEARPSGMAAPGGPRINRLAPLFENSLTVAPEITRSPEAAISAAAVPMLSATAAPQAGALAPDLLTQGASVDRASVSGGLRRLGAGVTKTGVSGDVEQVEAELDAAFDANLTPKAMIKGKEGGTTGGRGRASRRDATPPNDGGNSGNVLPPEGGASASGAFEPNRYILSYVGKDVLTKKKKDKVRRALKSVKAKVVKESAFMILVKFEGKMEVLEKAVKHLDGWNLLRKMTPRLLPRPDETMRPTPKPASFEELDAFLKANAAKFDGITGLNGIGLGYEGEDAVVSVRFDPSVTKKQIRGELLGRIPELANYPVKYEKRGIAKARSKKRPFQQPEQPKQASVGANPSSAEVERFVNEQRGQIINNVAGVAFVYVEAKDGLPEILLELDGSVPAVQVESEALARFPALKDHRIRIVPPENPRPHPAADSSGGAHAGPSKPSKSYQQLKEVLHNYGGNIEIKGLVSMAIGTKSKDKPWLKLLVMHEGGESEEARLRQELSRIIPDFRKYPVEFKGGQEPIIAFGETSSEWTKTPLSKLGQPALEKAVEETLAIDSVEGLYAAMQTDSAETLRGWLKTLGADFDKLLKRLEALIPEHASSSGKYVPGDIGVPVAAELEFSPFVKAEMQDLLRQSFNTHNQKVVNFLASFGYPADKVKDLKLSVLSFTDISAPRSLFNPTALAPTVAVSFEIDVFEGTRFVGQIKAKIDLTTEALELSQPKNLSTAKSGAAPTPRASATESGSGGFSAGKGEASGGTVGGGDLGVGNGSGDGNAPGVGASAGGEERKPGVLYLRLKLEAFAGETDDKTQANVRKFIDGLGYTAFRVLPSPSRGIIRVLIKGIPVGKENEAASKLLADHPNVILQARPMTEAGRPGLFRLQYRGKTAVPSEVSVKLREDLQRVGARFLVDKLPEVMILEGDGEKLKDIVGLLQDWKLSELSRTIRGPSPRISLLPRGKAGTGVTREQIFDFMRDNASRLMGTGIAGLVRWTIFGEDPEIVFYLDGSVPEADFRDELLRRVPELAAYPSRYEAVGGIADLPYEDLASVAPGEGIKLVAYLRSRGVEAEAAVRNGDDNLTILVRGKTGGAEAILAASQKWKKLLADKKLRVRGQDHEQAARGWMDFKLETVLRNADDGALKIIGKVGNRWVSLRHEEAPGGRTSGRVFVATSSGLGDLLTAAPERPLGGDELLVVETALKDRLHTLPPSKNTAALRDFVSLIDWGRTVAFWQSNVDKMIEFITQGGSGLEWFGIDDIKQELVFRRDGFLPEEKVREKLLKKFPALADHPARYEDPRRSGGL